MSVLMMKGLVRSLPNLILYSGPVGCGKTSALQRHANESALNTEWVTNTAPSLEDLYAVAAKNDVVLVDDLTSGVLLSKILVAALNFPKVRFVVAFSAGVSDTAFRAVIEDFRPETAAVRVEAREHFTEKSRFCTDADPLGLRTLNAPQSTAGMHTHYGVTGSGTTGTDSSVPPSDVEKWRRALESQIGQYEHYLNELIVRLARVLPTPADDGCGVGEKTATEGGYSPLSEDLRSAGAHLRRLNERLHEVTIAIHL